MSIHADDEATRLRLRDADRDDAATRSALDPGAGSASLLARTKSLSKYPTAAARFFACTPLTVLGPEVEGGIGVVTAGEATFFALNLGSAVPPQGTAVVATFVDGRWVFRHDG